MSDTLKSKELRAAGAAVRLLLPGGRKESARKSEMFNYKLMAPALREPRIGKAHGKPRGK
jgi:hypothetical protein